MTKKAETTEAETAPVHVVERPTDRQYREADGFNQSTANQLLSKSPRHAWEYRKRQAQPPQADDSHSRDREIGTVVHKLLLGSTTAFHVIAGFDDYRTKAAQQQRAACELAGITPILPPDLERCHRSADAVREQLKEVFGIELDGVSEEQFYWTEDVPDPMNGRVRASVLCKAKLDHVCGDMLTVLDLKTGSDANPKGLMRRILDQGCHVQAASYLSAVAHADPRTVGRSRFIDVFVETTGLVMVTPVAIEGSLLELGQRAWHRACLKWHECQEAGFWPGYVTEVIAPPAPEWALKEEMLLE